MDYKKAYKEALSWIKALYPTLEGSMKEDAEHFFSELKESEDKEEELTEFEKNLQIIISEASHWTSDDGSISTYCQFGDKEIKKISGQLLDLARKELKESDDKDVRKELLEHCINRRDGKQVCVDASDYRRWADWLEKQGEQKSSWSKEDEERYLSCLKRLSTGNIEQPETVNTVWLKSIKDKYTWKPSDGQIKALKEACDEHWEPDGLDPLYTLYQDLKKLKE